MPCRTELKFELFMCCEYIQKNVKPLSPLTQTHILETEIKKTKLN